MSFSLAMSCAMVPAAAGQLRALAGIELHVVDEGTGGDVGQGQGVAGLDVGLGAGGDDVAHLQADGGDDVALLAVFILKQGDMGAAVGIVLQGLRRWRPCRSCSA